nr:4Fe-4S dicluster domain-containing protein [uncultured Holophaga sp.]
MSRSLHTTVMVDHRLCTACRVCELACAQAHGKTASLTVGSVREALVPRLFLTRGGTRALPVQCHQCEEAPCLASCRSHALRRQGQAIIVQEELCIGCHDCSLACPYGAIELVGGKAIKCDLCSGRAEGPACVAACPSGALSQPDWAGLRRQRQRAAAAAREVAL